RAGAPCDVIPMERAEMPARCNMGEKVPFVLGTWPRFSFSSFLPPATSLTRVPGRASHRFVRGFSHRSVISSATGYGGRRELTAAGHLGEGPIVTQRHHLWAASRAATRCRLCAASAAWPGTQGVGTYHSLRGCR